MQHKMLWVTDRTVALVCVAVAKSYSDCSLYSERQERETTGIQSVAV